jgi:hypothetical protein
MKTSKNLMRATIFSFAVANAWIADAQAWPHQITQTPPPPTTTKKSGDSMGGVSCLNGLAYPCAYSPSSQPNTGSNVGRNTNTNVPGQK